MFFWNSLTFSMIQRMLAIWSLVPLPFLKLAWISGSSWFIYWLIIYGLCYVEVGSFYAHFLKNFNHKCVLNFVCLSIEIIIWFLSFNLLTWYITLIHLHILKNPCIPGINSTWSWCMSSLMCWWILFAKTLLRIFASMFISDIGLQFSFFVLSLSCFGIRVMVAS